MLYPPMWLLLLKVITLIGACDAIPAYTTTFRCCCMCRFRQVTRRREE